MKNIFYKKLGIALIITILLVCFVESTDTSSANSRTFQNFVAHTYIHPLTTTNTEPHGLSPQDIRKAYNLPQIGGSGTIAIVTAYHYQNIESDLNVFNLAFGLPSCTTKNSCLEVHQITTKIPISNSWNLETALDTEWAHAIAPQAKILVIESKSSSGPDLLKAITYATSRKDVVAVSMSWGGPEFKDELTLDKYFSKYPNITFFAASGDQGSGTSWPAAAPNVVAVGGSSLLINSSKTITEKAWSGSGGGVSLYESQPGWQKSYAISKANHMRAIPDVSYNADPNSGYSVYKNGWYVVGGTSAGSPQWAAIRASGSSVKISKLYQDKASTNSSQYFRDIISGSNGTCTYYCDARARYDYVTGLGSPLTVNF